MYNERAGHIFNGGFRLKFNENGQKLFGPGDFIPPVVDGFIPPFFDMSGGMTKGRFPFVPDNIPFLDGKIPFIDGGIPFIDGKIPSIGQYFSNRDSIRIEISKDKECDPKVTELQSDLLVIDFTLVQAGKQIKWNDQWKQ